jgi:hypothetical protein
VAYLNVDISVAGSRWTASASPSLAHIFKKAALDIPHPTIPGKTLWDTREDDGPYKGSIDGLSPLPAIDAEYLATYELTEKRRRALDTGILPLGSGSDFTVFLQRLGVGLLFLSSYRALFLNRLQALMKASHSHLLMQSTTTIPFTTLRDGRKSMPIQGSTVMCVARSSSDWCR